MGQTHRPGSGKDQAEKRDDLIAPGRKGGRECRQHISQAADLAPAWLQKVPDSRSVGHKNEDDA